MEPSYYMGDHIIYQRIAYLEFGDAVVIHADKKNYTDRHFPQNEDRHKILRIIGTPGDVVVIKDGKVLVNASEDDQAYTKEIYYPTCFASTGCKSKNDIEGKTYNVPEDSYFLLGDSRESSFDSRFAENPYYHKKVIAGKVIKSFDLTHLF
jgi:signal peptidase I